MKKLLVALSMCLILFSGSSFKNNEPLQKEVQTYLDAYNIMFQKLLIANNEAQWKLNTMIIEGDTATSKMATDAAEAFASFTGSEENIEKTQIWLKSKDKLLLYR